MATRVTFGKGVCTIDRRDAATLPLLAILRSTHELVVQIAPPLKNLPLKTLSLKQKQI